MKPLLSLVLTFAVVLPTVGYSQSGSERVVGEGYHRYQEGRCREVAIVILDECGRLIPTRVIRVECERPDATWAEVDRSVYVQDQMVDGYTPQPDSDGCFQSEGEPIGIEPVLPPIFDPDPGFGGFNPPLMQ